MAALLVMAAAMAAATPAWAMTPEQTIQAIQDAEEAAKDWIDDREEQYEDFLLTNPPVSAAAQKRDQTIQAMDERALAAENQILALMAQHPGNQEVQQAGQEAIDEVYDTADSESQTAIDAYNVYVTTATTTTQPHTTTSTQPTTSTSQPATTTSTPTSTSSTVPSSTATTTPQSSQAPGSTTSTTTAPVETDGEQEVAAPIGGSGPTRPGLVAAGDLDPDPRLASGSITSSKSFDIDPVLDLLRLRLPSVLSEPLVDLLVILNAIAAAFMSGMNAVGLPSALLIAGFLSVQGYQALRRRSEEPAPAALSR